MSDIHHYEIPVADLQDYTSKDPDRVERFITTVGEALEKIGFFALKNHCIDKSLIARAYKESEALFSLPTEVKKNYEIPGLLGQRGYVGLGREHAKGEKTPDLKEFWHIGREQYDTSKPYKHLEKNIWPPEKVPNFEKELKDLYEQIDLCALTLLEACALYLGEAKDRFSEMAVNGDSILRVIHYPPVKDGSEVIRAGAHEDINLITLLCESTSEGLQLQTHDGKWHSLSRLYDHIIVDSGDMLQNITNGIFKSTTHRVVNPKGNSSPRLSMPFFCHPRRECSLAPLPKSIQRSSQEATYPNITAGDYLFERLREIGMDFKSSPKNP